MLRPNLSVLESLGVRRQMTPRPVQNGGGVKLAAGVGFDASASAPTATDERLRWFATALLFRPDNRVQTCGGSIRENGPAIYPRLWWHVFLIGASYRVPTLLTLALPASSRISSISQIIARSDI